MKSLAVVAVLLAVVAVPAAAQCVPPSITSHPISGTITQDDPLSLSVTASGTEPFTYAWSAREIQSGNVSAAGTTQTINPTPTFSTQYSVVVSNACGSATSFNGNIGVRPNPGIPFTWNMWSRTFAEPDFNGDGHSDQLLINESTGALMVVLLNGINEIASAVIGDPGVSWRVAGVTDTWTDAHGDGRSEIFLQNNDTGAIAVWYVNGTTFQISQAQISPGRQWIMIGTTRALFSQFVLRNPSTGQTQRCHREVVNLQWTCIIDPTTTFDNVFAAADYDGDTSPDLVAQNGSGRIVIYRRNGAASIVLADAGPGLGWEPLGVAKLTTEVYPDLVMRHTASGDVAVWVLNRNPQNDLPIIADQRVIANPGTAWRPVEWGDFNNDNLHDLVMHNESTGQIGRWQMNGLTIQAGDVYKVPPPGWVPFGNR